MEELTMVKTELESAVLDMVATVYKKIGMICH